MEITTTTNCELLPLAPVGPMYCIVPVCPEHGVRMVHNDDTPLTSPWQRWRCPHQDCRHRELTEWVAGYDA